MRFKYPRDYSFRKRISLMSWRHDIDATLNAFRVRTSTSMSSSQTWWKTWKIRKIVYDEQSHFSFIRLGSALQSHLFVFHSFWMMDHNEDRLTFFVANIRAHRQKTILIHSRLFAVSFQAIIESSDYIFTGVVCYFFRFTYFFGVVCTIIFIQKHRWLCNNNVIMVNCWLFQRSSFFFSRWTTPKPKK